MDFQFKVMMPNDPNILEGETLVLNCTITKIYDNFNASMIYVRSKNISYTAPRHIFPLNEKTAQFRLEKVGVNNTGLFYCAEDNKRLKKASQYVHVFSELQARFVILIIQDGLVHVNASQYNTPQILREV